ncbi:hypothetical protein Dimus_014743 [Dionaea muscipula]
MGWIVIVPFVPVSSDSPDQCNLVVDLGRDFGPIPLLKDTCASSFPRMGLVGLSNEGVGQRLIASAEDDLSGQQSERFNRSQHDNSQIAPTSQQVIANLGQQGRLLGDSSNTMTMPASGARGGIREEEETGYGPSSGGDNGGEATGSINARGA